MLFDALTAMSNLRRARKEVTYYNRPKRFHERITGGHARIERGQNTLVRNINMLAFTSKVSKIFHLPNRANWLSRQICKGSLSLMRCNCRIVQKFLYLPNRTNRWNTTSIVFRSNLVDSIGHGWCPEGQKARHYIYKYI